MASASTFIVKIAKPAGGGKAGKDAAGLLRYLYGPGKSDEHTDQHLVAGSMGLAMAYPGVLSSREATSLGRVIESSWRHQYADQLTLVGANTGGPMGGQVGGVPRSVMAYQAGPAGVPEVEKEYAYHLIASLPPGPPGHGWSDEQWATIAQDLVSGMGFSDGPDDEAGCRWVAVRHGLSAGGNDHLHVVVNLVRQDGRRASTHNDFVRARTVRQQIEQSRDFVVPLHDPGKEPARSLPAYTMAEHQRARERATATGSNLPDRTVLQQALRAAVGAARTEVEWIAAVLDAHPQIELEAARWARRDDATDRPSSGLERGGSGGRDVVTGYKVRLGDGPWFSASALAPDLTLQTLRPTWQAHEDENSRAAALALWRDEAELPDTTVSATGVAVTAHLDAAAQDLTAWAQELADVEPHDTPTWDQALHDAAAVTSALSRVEGRTGQDLARVGQVLTRHSLATTPPDLANLGPAPALDDRAGAVVVGGGDDRAVVVAPVRASGHAQRAAGQVQRALRASSPDSHLGWLAVLQQMRAVMTAIEDAQRARGELTRATELARAAGILDHTSSALHSTLGSHDLEEVLQVMAARETAAHRTPRTPPAPVTPGALPGQPVPTTRTPHQSPGPVSGGSPADGMDRQGR